jgi:hypothetical protein
VDGGGGNAGADRGPHDGGIGGVQGGGGRGSGGGGGRRGRGDYGGVGGRKRGEPDLEEKFGRFDIKPPVRPSASSSVQGDETVSMVSDTWSTDVLASDTETLGESDCGGGRRLEDLVRRDNMEEMVRNRMLDELAVPPAAGGSLASASAASLLDVETASEAWSMDVLASDSESLRLGDLDYEDTASVARSDDTRFTDDTSEPLLDMSGNASSVASAPASAHGRRYHQRSGRDDVTQMLRGRGGQQAADGGGAGGSAMRPSRAAAVEQWARQSSGPGSAGGGSSRGMIRRGSDSSGIGAEAMKGRRLNLAQSGSESILKKSSSPAAAPSTTSPPPSSGTSSSAMQSSATTSSATKTVMALSGATSSSPKNAVSNGAEGQAGAGTAGAGAAVDAASAVVQLSTHLSVTSIASSTESSGESAEGAGKGKVVATATTGNGTAAAAASSDGVSDTCDFFIDM